MVSRAFAAVLVMGLLCSVSLAEKPEIPSSNVIRPRKVDAKVKGCQVSEPGEYRATAGDLIELEYTFPVTPATVPRVVSREWDKGAIYGSRLGIRNLVVPSLVGTGTYLFYFDARHEGSGTAIVVVGDVKYEYRFEVAEGREKNRKDDATKERPIAARLGLGWG